MGRHRPYIMFHPPAFTRPSPPPTSSGLVPMMSARGTTCSRPAPPPRRLLRLCRARSWPALPFRTCPRSQRILLDVHLIPFLFNSDPKVPRPPATGQRADSPPPRNGSVMANRRTMVFPPRPVRGVEEFPSACRCARTGARRSSSLRLSRFAGRRPLRNRRSS